MVNEVNYLATPAVQKVRAREHLGAEKDEGKLAAVRPEIDAAKAAGKSTFDLYPDDVYLAIKPAMGQFLYLTAKAIGAKRIVEFGTSFGISTIYLAAAALETGGRVIGSELVEAKATRAQANLEEARVSDVVDIRVGDALETLKDIEGPVDLLFLDGWKDLYIPVLELMLSRLRPGSVVLADNIFTFPDELAPYLETVDVENGDFRSVVIPFESGLAYSLYTGVAEAT